MFYRSNVETNVFVVGAAEVSVAEPFVLWEPGVAEPAVL
jgi:hypothetical protein